MNKTKQSETSLFSVPKIWRANSMLQWRHNEHSGASNHQPHDCLLNLLFRHTSKKTSKPRVTGLCEGNSPVTGEFPTQSASNAGNASICKHIHTYISNNTALESRAQTCTKHTEHCPCSTPHLVARRPKLYWHRMNTVDSTRSTEPITTRQVRDRVDHFSPQ